MVSIFFVGFTFIVIPLLLFFVIYYKPEGGKVEKKELNEKKKKLIKNLSTLELCPRCFHYICLKDGKCPHCGLTKKGDEWIMTKEGFEEKEKEKEVEEKEDDFLEGIITFDEGDEKDEEENEKE